MIIFDLRFFDYLGIRFFWESIYSCSMVLWEVLWVIVKIKMVVVVLFNVVFGINEIFLIYVLEVRCFDEVLEYINS